VKGIAHFVAGLAVATFFPEIVHSASQNLSFGPLLGGFAGLLPDTLDFKFVRYFARLDAEVDPAKLTTEAGHPDPQAIAERIAAAMNRACESGKRVKVHLHTLRLGTDRWRRYSVAFDLAHSEVVVRIGPVVTTAQMPYAGSEIPDLEVGRAQVRARILQTYDGETEIDIFSGPSLAFERALKSGFRTRQSGRVPTVLRSRIFRWGATSVKNHAALSDEKADDGVEVSFLPWHRAWTHSLAMALLLGAAGFLLAPVCGLVMALAMLAHVALDQLGFMGSNLFFPLTRNRTTGLRWLRSGDAIPNFLTVWVGLAVILLNLDRFSGVPLIPVLPFVLGVIVVPGIIFLGSGAWAKLRARRQPAAVLRGIMPGAMAAVEALDETAEVDI
jgi:ABC-type amino acid transport system permease subunit